MPDRYLHSANATVGTVCRECGAGMIHDTTAHDALHDRLDAIERVQRSLCGQHV